MSICLPLHSACVRICQRGFVSGQQPDGCKVGRKTQAYEAAGLQKKIKQASGRRRQPKSCEESGERTLNLSISTYSWRRKHELVSVSNTGASTEARIIVSVYSKKDF